MAYSTTPKYSQSIQFTYNKTPYDSYGTAVQAVTKKNLLPGEPATCFYRNDDGDLKVLLAVGTFHNYEKPLILAENNNPGEIYAELESLNDKIGSGDWKLVIPGTPAGEEIVYDNITDILGLISGLIGLEPNQGTKKLNSLSADSLGYSDNGEKYDEYGPSIITNLNAVQDVVDNIIKGIKGINDVIAQQVSKSDLINPDNFISEDGEVGGNKKDEWSVYTANSVDTLLEPLRKSIQDIVETGLFVTRENDDNSLVVSYKENVIDFQVDGGEISF